MARCLAMNPNFGAGTGPGMACSPPTLDECKRAECRLFECAGSERILIPASNPSHSTGGAGVGENQPMKSSPARTFPVPICTNGIRSPSRDNLLGAHNPSDASPRTPTCPPAPDRRSSVSRRTPKKRLDFLSGSPLRLVAPVAGAMGGSEDASPRSDLSCSCNTVATSLGSTFASRMSALASTAPKPEAQEQALAGMVRAASAIHQHTTSQPPTAVVSGAGGPLNPPPSFTSIVPSVSSIAGEAPQHYFFSKFENDFKSKLQIGYDGRVTLYKAPHGLDGVDSLVKKVSSNDAECSYTHKFGCRQYARVCKEWCPYIVSYYDAWEERGDFFLRVEYCEEGTLEEWVHCVGFLDKRMIQRIFVHLAQAIHHIHKHNVAHCNITPKTVYVTRPPEDPCGLPIFKLGDFEHSAFADINQMTKDLDVRALAFLIDQLVTDHLSELGVDPQFTSLLNNMMGMRPLNSGMVLQQLVSTAPGSVFADCAAAAPLVGYHRKSIRVLQDLLKKCLASSTTFPEAEWRRILVDGPAL